MTLTLSQLRAELDRLRDAHPLTATNVVSVSTHGTGIALAFDESELRGQIAEAESERARIERLYDRECDKSLALRSRAEFAEKQLTELRASTEAIAALAAK